MNAPEVQQRHRRRTGEFRPQAGGYAAFVPEPLRPDMLNLDAELSRLLGDAASALGRLDGAAMTLPDPDLFVTMYSLKEALLSSQIEGTQASLVDVLQYEAEGEEPARQREKRSDAREVVNHQQAIHYGLRRIAELPICKRLLREIHGVLMSGVRGQRRRPGEFRRSQNWVGEPGSTIEEATYVPPPVPEMHDALDDMERYIHEDRETHVLIKSGLVHYQFETIHPFEDGNGRMGRLLITFLLAKEKMLQRPLLYLSVYLKEHKARYYELLNRVRETGDYESWIKFFLRGIREVAREATETAREIRQMRDEHLGFVRANVGSPHAPRFLDQLMEDPAVTANEAAEKLEVSYPTANNLIADLAELGLLSEVTGRQRNRVFIYAPYVEKLGGALEPTEEAGRRE